MTYNAHDTTDHIILSLKTFEINRKHVQIVFGHIFYGLHGDMDSNSFRPVCCRYNRHRSSVNLGYLVRFRL
jgi:hypothetical protein